MRCCAIITSYKNTCPPPPCPRPNSKNFFILYVSRPKKIPREHIRSPEDYKRSCRERIGLMGPFVDSLPGANRWAVLLQLQLCRLYAVRCRAYALRITVLSATAFHLSGKLCAKSAILSTVRRLSSRTRCVLALRNCSTSSFCSSVSSYSSSIPHSLTT